MPFNREKLNAFLDISARKPFEWGQSDCMLEVADWLDFYTGSKIAADWRGRYGSEEELEVLFGPDVSLEIAMRAEAERHGLVETAEPQVGDVGLVALAEQEKPLGAILMPSKRWRMKTIAGVVLTKSVQVIVAWSLPPCRL